MKVEIEIDEGDVIKFNDETWQVVDYQPHNNSFDMRSTIGRLENFTHDEIENQIQMTGKFSRIKESYVGID